MKESPTKHYCVVSIGDNVWGVGRTKLEAIKDAKREPDFKNLSSYIIVSCTQELANYVRDHGGENFGDWCFVDGILSLRESHYGE